MKSLHGISLFLKVLNYMINQKYKVSSYIKLTDFLDENFSGKLLLK